MKGYFFLGVKRIEAPIGTECGVFAAQCRQMSNVVQQRARIFVLYRDRWSICGVIERRRHQR